mmetsp:Transcript_18748/g.33733  ORF Transcript_18748/g.33733 Transcript_18748/m.33733 type:complete len:101 (-) Transcript_18748:102-404(-)
MMRRTVISWPQMSVPFEKAGVDVEAWYGFNDGRPLSPRENRICPRRKCYAAQRISHRVGVRIFPPIAISKCWKLAHKWKPVGETARINTSASEGISIVYS